MDAHAHCREVTRRCAGNFYHGLKLLDARQREAMYALYAWMRRADDLADGAPCMDGPRAGLPGAGDSVAGPDVHGAEARRLLGELGRRTVEVLEGGPVGDDPVFIALADAARWCSLPAEDFLAMIEGQLADLRFTQPEDFAALERYCRCVASSVGRLCVRIWGRSDEEALQLAQLRGIAFQLTNILRDFKEDHAAGRVYLPSREFAQAGLTPRALLSWEDGTRCADFVLSQVARAQSYYDRSAPLDQMIPSRPRAALYAMTKIYQGILEQIARRPFRIVSVPRISLSAGQKWLIALRARLA